MARTRRFELGVRTTESAYNLWRIFKAIYVFPPKFRKYTYVLNSTTYDFNLDLGFVPSWNF